jgi:hypothetical protein
MGMAMGLGVALLVQRPVSAAAAPANSLRELGAELSACLPPSDASEDRELTIVLSLKRDGALLGKPRISYSKLPGDPEVERRFGETVERALNHCFPISITDALGGAIAGRPIPFRIIWRRKSTES